MENGKPILKEQNIKNTIILAMGSYFELILHHFG